VDTYDALSHDRVYRPALPEDEVLAIMQQGAGTHFDPLLLALFFAHLDQICHVTQEHPDEWIEPDFTGRLSSPMPLETLAVQQIVHTR
jgi:putative two-component system response regulator